MFKPALRFIGVLLLVLLFLALLPGWSARGINVAGANPAGGNPALLARPAFAADAARSRSPQVTPQASLSGSQIPGSLLGRPLRDSPAIGRRAPAPRARAASVALSAPSGIVMTENFEGSWPSYGWSVSGGSSSDGGEYLLGKRSCHPHNGSYGGWTVGGGADGSYLSCSSSYPNSVATAAEYGPIDLSDATSATLTYYYWGQAEMVSESCADELDVADAVAGGYYDHGWYYCGDFTNGPETYGYNKGVLDLSARLGQPEVYVAIGFFSDDSVTYGGFTVDDISLNITRSGGTPTPTATPSRTPTKTPTRGPGWRATYLPLILLTKATPPCPNDPYEPNGSFAEAWGPLPLNQDFYGYFNCSAETDRDYYYFDLSGQTRVVITLNNIPAGSDYDLTLYNCASANCMIKHSGNPGSGGESITADIGAGRYFVRVVRSQTSPLVSPGYRLRVATQ
jgi:hypothetical protein